MERGRYAVGEWKSQEGVMENCHTGSQELEPAESSQTPGQGFVWQVVWSSGLMWKEVALWFKVYTKENL